MSVYRRAVAVLSVVVLSGVLFGCSNTWEGFKKDTGQNMESTGHALENAGKDVKN